MLQPQLPQAHFWQHARLTGHLRPGREAGGYEDPRLFALSYALLAPNPHNRQPWLIELKGQDGFRLHRDETRNLPHTDPFDRQIFVGLGCFLEQAAIAATLRGKTATIDLFPEGTDGVIADVVLTEGADTDPLAAHMLERRSCKEPFKDRPVPASSAADLSMICNDRHGPRASRDHQKTQLGRLAHRNAHTSCLEGERRFDALWQSRDQRQSGWN